MMKGPLLTQEEKSSSDPRCRKAQCWAPRPRGCAPPPAQRPHPPSAPRSPAPGGGSSLHSTNRFYRQEDRGENRNQPGAGRGGQGGAGRGAYLGANCYVWDNAAERRQTGVGPRPGYSSTRRRGWTFPAAGVGRGGGGRPAGPAGMRGMRPLPAGGAQEAGGSASRGGRRNPLAARPGAGGGVSPGRHVTGRPHPRGGVQRAGVQRPRDSGGLPAAPAPARKLGAPSSGGGRLPRPKTPFCKEQTRYCNRPARAAAPANWAPPAPSRRHRGPDSVRFGLGAAGGKCRAGAWGGRGGRRGRAGAARARAAGGKGRVRRAEGAGAGSGESRGPGGAPRPHHVGPRKSRTPPQRAGEHGDAKRAGRLTRPWHTEETRGGRSGGAGIAGADPTAPSYRLPKWRRRPNTSPARAAHWLEPSRGAGPYCRPLPMARRPLGGWGPEKARLAIGGAGRPSRRQAELARAARGGAKKRNHVVACGPISEPARACCLAGAAILRMGTWRVPRRETCFPLCRRHLAIGQGPAISRVEAQGHATPSWSRAV